MNANNIKNLLIILGIIFLDQASKFLAPRFGFEVVSNRGIAFGLFPDAVWVIVMPLLLLVAIIYRSKLGLSLITYKRSLISYKRSLISGEIHLSLILAGGFSNLLDRLFFGAVRDWIAFPWIPTFNLADLAISTGFLLLVLTLIKPACRPACRQDRQAGR